MALRKRIKHRNRKTPLEDIYKYIGAQWIRDEPGV